MFCALLRECLSHLGEEAEIASGVGRVELALEQDLPAARASAAPAAATGGRRLRRRGRHLDQALVSSCALLVPGVDPVFGQGLLGLRAQAEIDRQAPR
jgi:hypothetical protein